MRVVEVGHRRRIREVEVVHPRSEGEEEHCQPALVGEVVPLEEREAVGRDEVREHAWPYSQAAAMAIGASLASLPEIGHASRSNHARCALATSLASGSPECTGRRADHCHGHDRGHGRKAHTRGRSR